MDNLESYLQSTRSALDALDLGKVHLLAEELREAWIEGRQVFVCGNGGSAANAIHIANDLFFGVAKKAGRGMRIQALPANQAVMTCLANDLSYDAIFAEQLEVLAHPGDMLVALSGSGNSRNILAALDAAKALGMTSWALLGFSGGASLARADHAIHLPIHDMQVSEDFQLIVGHMVMQWLRDHPPVRAAVPLTAASPAPCPTASSS